VLQKKSTYFLVAPEGLGRKARNPDRQPNPISRFTSFHGAHCTAK
jgi:hypothetical protein